MANWIPEFIRSGSRMRDIVAHGILIAGTAVVVSLWLKGARSVETSAPFGPPEPGKVDGKAVAKLGEPKTRNKPAESNKSLELVEKKVSPPATLPSKDQLAPARQTASSIETMKPASNTNSPLTTKAEMPQLNVVSTVRIDRSGVVATPELLAPNAVEKNPQALSELSPEQVEDLARAYFGWKEKERLRIILDFTNVSPEQLDSVLAGCLLQSSSSPGWILRQKDGVTRLDNEPSGKLFGDLRRGKWTVDLEAFVRDFYGAGANVSAKLVLTDRTAIEMFRQLAAGLKKRADAGSNEFIFNLKASNETVTVELIANSGR